MEGHVTAAHAFREEGMVLVVLPHHYRADAGPGDEVVAYGVHGRDAGRGHAHVGVRAPAAVSGVGHIEAAVQLRDPRVLHAARLGGALGHEHRLTQPVPVHSVFADGVADARNVVHALRAVVHVPQSVVEDHGWVEDVQRLPRVGRVGLQDGVVGVTDELQGSSKETANTCMVSLSGRSMPTRLRAGSTGTFCRYMRQVMRSTAPVAPRRCVNSYATDSPYRGSWHQSERPNSRVWLLPSSYSRVSTSR